MQNENRMRVIALSDGCPLLYHERENFVIKCENLCYYGNVVTSKIKHLKKYSNKLSLTVSASKTGAKTEFNAK